ncbi:putative PAS domain containing protein [Lyophyllum shimeji]|uniref:PAS domain containing protein n=1 Tax=Lyophyllum shimeji TaxID=47721 RepID=A0A9P3UUF5_LYOSH|nr:putative PAS domain containing protein [Lyophyllum shimeji]
MPFSRYLQSDNVDQPPPVAVENNGLQFQIPSFMYSGAPTLAPGGGAEVLPFNSTWLTNSGFANTYTSPSPPLPKESLINISAPSPLGLPVYSASGFDVLSILARVATRCNPRVALGPVDMTCSFVVVDTRRHDHPIVYCSPTFCRLTGYEEHEILGRNCRFLQAPGGAVRRGEPRRFTSQQAVNTLRKACAADKEVQTSIVNFRKDGSAFINLVSVIPITGGVSGGKHELNDVVYHVGFQVDLTEQPNIILDKLRDGTYVPTEPSSLGHPSAPAAAHALHLDQPIMHRRTYTIPQLTMSPTLSALLLSTSFLRSLPVSTATTAPAPLPVSANPPAPGTTNSPLSLILLEYAPDFIHVVSLKGAFQYVAPAVTRVLGYTPSELVGKSLADLAHPEDVVPLERQLKESSTLLPSASSAAADETTAADQPHPHALGAVQARIIDVLFRARTKAGVYVWVECRGRLHVEPGKGRKAIILSGRARAMPRLCWGDVVRAAGGVAAPVQAEGEREKTARMTYREVWVQLAGRGRSAGAVVAVGAGVEDVLGYTAEELMGRRIATLVVEGAEGVCEALKEDMCVGAGKAKEGPVGEEETHTRATTMWGRLRTKAGGVVGVLMVFYRCGRNELDAKLRVAPPPVLVQIRPLDDAASSSGVDTLSNGGTSPAVTYPLDANVFEELEVSRGSSWQYELQQLRFANRRLKEEVEALEAEVAQQEKLEDAAGTQQEPSSSSATIGFEDPATAGMGISDNVYPDMSLELGMNIGGVEHTNYTVALERYAAAAGITRPPTGMRGFAATTTTNGIMPATPMGMPILRPYQDHLLPPPRAQTPARIPLEQRVRRSSVSLQPQQHQHGLYAPVPLPVGRSTALMQAMGQGSSQHLQRQPMPLQRAPSRMEQQPYSSQMQAPLRGLDPSEAVAQDWGTMRQSVKRPLER